MSHPPIPEPRPGDHHWRPAGEFAIINRHTSVLALASRHAPISVVPTHQGLLVDTNAVELAMETSHGSWTPRLQALVDELNTVRGRDA